MTLKYFNSIRSIEATIDRGPLIDGEFDNESFGLLVEDSQHGNFIRGPFFSEEEAIGELIMEFPMVRYPEEAFRPDGGLKRDEPLWALTFMLENFLVTNDEGYVQRFAGSNWRALNSDMSKDEIEEWYSDWGTLWDAEVWDDLITIKNEADVLVTFFNEVSEVKDLIKMVKSFHDHIVQFQQFATDNVLDRLF